MSLFAFRRAISDRCALAHRFYSEFHTFGNDVLADGDANRK